MVCSGGGGRKQKTVNPQESSAIVPVHLGKENKGTGKTTRDGKEIRVTRLILARKKGAREEEQTIKRL